MLKTTKTKRVDSTMEFYQRKTQEFLSSIKKAPPAPEPAGFSDEQRTEVYRLLGLNEDKKLKYLRGNVVRVLSFLLHLKKSGELSQLCPTKNRQTLKVES